MTENEKQILDFNLEDLDLMVKFIDIAGSRGAVRGDEMLSIGGLRQRLVSVLQAATSGNNQQKQSSVQLDTNSEPPEISDDAD